MSLSLHFKNLSSDRKWRPMVILVTESLTYKWERRRSLKNQLKRIRTSGPIRNAAPSPDSHAFFFKKLVDNGKNCKNGLNRFKKMIYTPPKNFLLTQAKKFVVILKKAFLYIFYVTLWSTRVKKNFPQKKPFGVFFSCTMLYNNC